MLLIAPAGHTSKQREQPLILFRECAHIVSSKFTYIGFSNSPISCMASRSSLAIAWLSSACARKYPSRFSQPVNNGVSPVKSIIMSQLVSTPSCNLPNKKLLRLCGAACANLSIIKSKLVKWPDTERIFPVVTSPTLVVASRSSFAFAIIIVTPRVPFRWEASSRAALAPPFGLPASA